MTSTTAAQSDTAAPVSIDIRVNRRPFMVPAGTTGAEIAALLGVPANNAVVEILEPGGGPREIALDAPAPLAAGADFLVTRQFVTGGAS